MAERLYHKDKYKKRVGEGSWGAGEGDGEIEEKKKGGGEKNSSTGTTVW